MSKRPEKRNTVRRYGTTTTATVEGGSGGGLCLLMTLSMLALPTTVVALIAKRARR